MFFVLFCGYEAVRVSLEIRVCSVLNEVDYARVYDTKVKIFLCVCGDDYDNKNATQRRFPLV